MACRIFFLFTLAANTVLTKLLLTTNGNNSGGVNGAIVHTVVIEYINYTLKKEEGRGGNGIHISFT